MPVWCGWKISVSWNINGFSCCKILFSTASNCWSCLFDCFTNICTWRLVLLHKHSHSVAYAETFHGGGFIQRHRVVTYIWCALFVTSQNYVIVLFSNQRFGEVCWYNMHIFLYIHSFYFMCQCTEYKLLELQVRLSEDNTYTQRYDTAVRNCKKY